MAKVGTQRGLKNYIQELRSCTTKDAEVERVQKELGKIRKKYTSDKAMSAYDRRKYLWKLMYTKMLGYEVDFGHKQAMDMMAASTFAEKQVGYVVCGLFLSENDELLRLVINSVRSDLLSRNEAFQCLALEFTANVGGAEFAQLLTADVMEVLSHGATRPVVRKKAALCLLRLLRKSTNEDSVSAAEWGPRMATLLEERDLGVLLGLTTLLIGIVSRSYEGYEACVPRLVQILERLREKDVSQDYTYYGIPSPWLQVRALRALQYFPPPEDPRVAETLKNILVQIITSNEPIKNANKNNALHAIVFEAAGVAVNLGDEELCTLVVNLFARFLTVRESNLRYLALENIGRLSQSEGISSAVAKHQKTIISCMSDQDMTIRSSALDLLFTTANGETAAQIVEELLSAIENADYSLREELVLKAAVLAERFPRSSEWYIDSMLRLIMSAGDAVTRDVWHSVVHLVSSQKTLQPYAVNKIISVLEKETANEHFMCCAAFILGEFGDQVEFPTSKQYELLSDYYPIMSPQARSILLNCFEKMLLRLPEDHKRTQEINSLIEGATKSLDVEVQQRAMEYRGLSYKDAAAEIALQPLPVWEVKSSVLLRRLVRSDSSLDETRERPSWMNTEEEVANDMDNVQEKEPSLTAPLHVEPEILVVPQQSEVVDLLDFGDEPENMVTENTAAMANEVEEPIQKAIEEKEIVTTEPIGDMKMWHKALCVMPTGLLYEDHNLQIGIKMRSQGPRLDMDFYLGNKTAGILQLKRFVIPPSPSFQVNTGSAPPEIDPGRQIQISCSFTCIAPYRTFPILQCNYVNAYGDAMARSLDLPISIAKFMKPVNIPSNVFETRWSQVTGAPFKLTEIVKPASDSLLDDKSIRSTLANMNLQVLDDVDLGDGSICAVAIFSYMDLEINQIPCMVSMAANQPASMLSLSVATADATVSDALRTLLVLQLHQ